MNNVLDLKHLEDSPSERSGTLAASFLSGPEDISWTFEQRPTERQRMREYLFLGGTVVIGGVVSWWQSSWLTFMVIVLGTAVWELHNRLPASHRIAIDDKGISVDGYRHRYEHLRSYDIHGMPDGSTRLSLVTTRWHLPQLHIPLGDQDPERVRATLAHYLLQEEHKIPLIEYFIGKP